MSGPNDLLDILALIDEPEDVVRHALMPWMGAACGTASACGGSCGGGCPPQADRHHFTTQYAEVDCPLCLAAFGGLDGLRAEARRVQGHQAPVTA